MVRLSARSAQKRRRRSASPSFLRVRLLPPQQRRHRRRTSQRHDTRTAGQRQRRQQAKAAVPGLGGGLHRILRVGPVPVAVDELDGIVLVALLRRVTVHRRRDPAVLRHRHGDVIRPVVVLPPCQLSRLLTQGIAVLPRLFTGDAQRHGAAAVHGAGIRAACGSLRQGRTVGCRPQCQGKRLRYGGCAAADRHPHRQLRRRCRRHCRDGPQRQQQGQQRRCGRYPSAHSAVSSCGRAAAGTAPRRRPEPAPAASHRGRCPAARRYPRCRPWRW